MLCKHKNIFYTEAPVWKIEYVKYREGSRENYTEVWNENSTQFKRNEFLKAIRNE